LKSLLVLVALISLAAAPAAWPDPDHSDNGWNRPAPQATLYSRLGGYDAIVALSNGFLRRMAADVTLGRFFVGLNQTSKNRVFQHVVDFLVVTTGGPGLYLGQDMKSAHKGLEITDDDFAIALRLLGATLDSLKVGAREKGEVLKAVGRLQDSIVQIR
jgi:hemoglobin